MIDDITISTPTNIARVIAKKHWQNCTTVTIQFTHPLWTATSGDGLPTLQFDQLNVIAHHLHAINTGETTWTDPLTWPDISDEAIALAIRKGIALPKLTRQKAQTLEEWPKFRDSEWSQLNKYENQGMFGKPIPRPPKDSNTVILPWVWTYLYKIDPQSLSMTPKSHAVLATAANATAK